MRLFRKWHPKDAPSLPGSNNCFRLLALVKDDIKDEFACFTDVKTGKIYIEECRSRHAAKMQYIGFYQIQDDKLFHSVFNFLMDPNVDVLRKEADKQAFAGIKELKVMISPSMYNLPRSSQGVPGSNLILT